MAVAGSIAEVLNQMKKDREDYIKGYMDYLKNNTMSPYEQGQADAKRDLERTRQMQESRYFLFYENHPRYPV